MIREIRALILVLLFLGNLQAQSGAAPQEEPAGIDCRVMSFNIRYFNGKDGVNLWGLRKHLVAGAVRFHRADIVGVQEALWPQMTYLIQELPEFGWVEQGRNGRAGGERCAIFFDKRRFKLADQGHFWLSRTPDRPSADWGARLRRICTWVALEPKAGGKRFFVFNTHFDHRAFDSRRKSAKLILKKIPELAGNCPVVLMGDFNCTESSTPYQTIVSELRDALRVAEEAPYGPSGTLPGFNRGDVPGPRIDFIFVKNDVRVIRHGVLSDTWDGRTSSDHRPILADLDVGSPYRPLALNYPHGWRFQADPERVGIKQRWFKNGLDDSKWKVLKIGEPWERQGFPDHDGVGWYRRWLHVPAAWKSENVCLMLHGVADAFTLFVGEEQVVRLGGPTNSLWEKTLSIQLPNSLIQFGKENLFVFRVVDTGGFGGLVGHPLVLRSDVEKPLYVARKSGSSRQKGTQPPKRPVKPPPRPRKVHEAAVYWQKSWYWFSKKTMHFNEGRALAEKMKGKLVHISSLEENDFLMSQIHGVTFIGLERIKGKWTLLDSNGKQFWFWDVGEPNNSRRERYGGIGWNINGRWHDFMDYEKRYICVEWGRN